MRNNVLFDFGDWEITKRELIAGISIVSILLIIGFFISNAISNDIADSNMKYDQAVQITDKETFEYGMSTNVGNAFVYGDLKAVDTVSYPEIDGQYMYIKKVKERYTRHTRTVHYTTGTGKTRQTHTRVETYWTWDEVGNERKTCKEIYFLDTVFDSNKINLPYAEHIDTIKESMRIRYKYYGVGTEYVGTIFTDLRNKTISDNTNFYNGYDIERTIEYLESDSSLIIFWLFWVVLIIACVIGFFVLDNKWLE